MEKHILYLRLSYWISALADFIVAWRVLLPHQMGLTDIAYPMGLASAAIFSWAIMLLVADRKPMERRWILIPTALVVSLITLVRLIFSLTGAIDFNIGLLLFGTGLALFLVFSYYFASRQEAAKTQ